MSELLHVNGLTKQFGGQPVLRDIAFRLAEGEVLAVLGRSGCGKTTLLKILAGLEAPEAGTLELHGQNLLPVPPNERQMVYLYQEPLLFPHLSVFENVAFGLRIRKVPRRHPSPRVGAGSWPAYGRNTPSRPDRWYVHRAPNPQRSRRISQAGGMSVMGKGIRSATPPRL